MNKTYAASILTLLISIGYVQAQDITVSSENVCNASINYYPDGDAEFKPGVGAAGPVVSADINKQAIELPEYIEYPLTLDLAQSIASLPNVEAINQEAELGTIRVYTDGRVTYNGTDITSKTEEYCKKNDTSADEESKPESEIE